jgi:hypothetical protein
MEGEAVKEKREKRHKHGERKEKKSKSGHRRPKTAISSIPDDTELDRLFEQFLVWNSFTIVIH